MVALSPSSPLRGRRGRPGRAFQDEAGIIFSDFGTLFIGNVPEPMQAPLTEAMIRGLSPAAIKAFGKTLGPGFRRELRRRASSAPEQVFGKLFKPLSSFICKALPGCDAETVSEDVANKRNTTIQGAHAWMIRPLVLQGTGLTTRRAPVAAAGLFLLQLDAKFSCIEHGNADEMFRFYPVDAPYPGARKAIEKGCATGLKIAART